MKKWEEDEKNANFVTDFSLDVAVNVASFFFHFGMPVSNSVMDGPASFSVAEDGGLLC